MQINVDYRSKVHPSFRRGTSKYVSFKKIISLGVITLLLVLVSTLQISGNWQTQSLTQEPIQHLVREGETLWSISLRYKHSQQDPRPFIEKLIQYNSLPSPTLQPGQILAIPVP